MKFLIWAWDYGTDSGGGIALHRLAHNLVQLGHDATLTCSHTAPGWAGRTRQTQRCLHEEIMIYPEIVEGNPFRGERVVRWLLNKPGFFGPGNGDGVYGENDLIMTWDERYSVGYTVAGKLTAWRDLAHFRDYHRLRAGTCSLVRKGKMSQLLHPLDPDAFCIDDYARRGGDNYLIDVFNRVESFTCYDDNSLIPTLAHLCGVPRIWIANGGKYLTRAEVAEQTALSLLQTREFVEACERQWPI